MANGISINAGTGTVTIRLDDGTGKTNAGQGDITLRDITAGVIKVINAVGGILSAAANTLATSAAGGITLTAATDVTFAHDLALVANGAGVVNINADGTFTESTAATSPRAATSPWRWTTWPWHREPPSPAAAT